MKILKSDTTKNVAAGGLVGGGGIAAVLASVRQSWPDLLPWSPDYDIGVVAVFSTLVAPVLARWFAFARHPEKKTRHYIKGLLIFVGVAFALQGCAGVGPAINGKTNYRVDFRDTTEEQDTIYSMKIKAPAGADLSTITGMAYDWNPDGSGSISVSQEGVLDTQKQANMITQVNQAQLDAFQRGVSTALNALAPFIGQYLDARVREGEIKAGVANNAISVVRENTQPKRRNP